MDAPSHIPVMCDEIVDILAPALSRQGAVLLDGTLGLGGHSAALLERFPATRLIGIDRDPHAIDIASQRLKPYANRVSIFHGTYDQAHKALEAAGVDRVSAVLFDLGLSSLHIDDHERGFAYSVDAPLMMRMDADESRLTAADVVNTYSEERIARLLFSYGDEKNAKRIARAIVVERENAPFTSSARLVEVITACFPIGRHTQGHPAKKTFQALRMEVNEERQSLCEALPIALSVLDMNGRMAVLSYHSGEDRLVKRAFAEASEDHVPQGMVDVPEMCRAQFRLVTRGAEQPSAVERTRNPRSRSAKLRVIERVKERP